MNREIYPGSLYPLTGDVASQTANPKVSVVGIQGIPIEQVTLFGGEAIEFDVNTNQWIPRLVASIQVNNVTVSDDPWISVNALKPVTVNGV